MESFGKRIFAVFTICLVLMPWCSAADEEKEEKVLGIGDKAPTFEAKDANGKDWKSSDYIGKKILVVYFYPAAMTGGCTKQACSFRDDKKDLMDLGAEVVGISGDRVSNLKIFKKVHNLNFILLSDNTGTIAKKFGVPMKEGGSIKRTVDGQEITMTRDVTTSRWTFIIDKEGNIIYKNTKVNAANDSEDVFAFIKKLKKTNTAKK